MREWATFQNATATAVEKSIEFAGRTWKPNRKLAYVTASFCHSLPLFNSKRRAFSAATLANSFQSAVMQMFDFEHRLEFYGAESDEICGAIAAAEYPDKDKALEMQAAGEAVPMKILFAIWRKAAGVEQALEEMASDKSPWRVSMECEFPWASCALWDGKEYHPWAELSADERSLVKPNTVEKLNGKPAVLVMGGEDSSVLFTGGALTKWPADKSADIESFAASDSQLWRPNYAFNTGWKSREDWMDAVASHKPASERSSIVIGKTVADNTGHCHEIASDFSVLPGDGDASHSHMMRLMSYDPNTGGLDGLCSTYSSYKDGSYQEHAHKFSLRMTPKVADQSGIESMLPTMPGQTSSIAIPRIDFAKLSKEIKSRK